MKLKGGGERENSVVVQKKQQFERPRAQLKEHRVEQQDHGPQQTEVLHEIDHHSQWVRLIELSHMKWGELLLGVVLFGSYVRGEQTAASDIDLLFIFRSGFELHRGLYREFDQLSKHLYNEANGRLGIGPHSLPLSPQFVVAPAASPYVDHEFGSLWLETALSSVVLSERDYQVSRILARVRQQMLEQRWERHYAHGQPYWVKPNHIEKM